MIRFVALCLLSCFAFTSTSNSLQSPPFSSIVAGSTIQTPPPFWENSFWGITPSIDRAFPFEIGFWGIYEVSEIEVAAYHYLNLAGSLAMFTIHVDKNGEPGDQIGAFAVQGISTVQQTHVAPAEAPFRLRTGEVYWLVGKTNSGQVNWNLGASTFGPAAYRVSGGEWQHINHSNVSAFVLLGSLVEPHLGDCDANGTLDADDFGFVSPCLLGPASPADPSCGCADLNGDESTDLLDVAAFERLISQ